MFSIKFINNQILLNKLTRPLVKTKLLMQEPSPVENSAQFFLPDSYILSIIWCITN
jgi:hypothetical protein